MTIYLFYFSSHLVEKVVRQPIGVEEVMAVSQHALVSGEGRGLERRQTALHLLGGVGRAVCGVLLGGGGAANKHRMRV